LLNRSHDYKQRLIGSKQALLATVALVGILWIGLSIWAVHAQEKQGKTDTVLFYEGQDLLAAKKPDAAIEKFQELLADYPRSNIRDLTYYWLGRSYLDLKKLQEAQEALTSLKKEFPMSPLVKSLERAVKTAEKFPGASAPPASKEPKFGEDPGNSKEEIRRKAVALYQKIIKESPDSPEAANAGDRLKEMGVEIKAEGAPSQSAALPQDPAQAEFEQDLDLFHRGNYSAAARRFQSFLEIHPDSPLRLKAEFYLAECYRLMEGEP
jgi:outer membrane protein assembly factor BamD (BamD/ComL family)